MTTAVLQVFVLDVVRALTDKEDSRVSPGVLGFVVVAILGVATWLLIRSMTRQFRKIDLPEGGTEIPKRRDAATPGDHEGNARPSDPDPS